MKKTASIILLAFALLSVYAASLSAQEGKIVPYVPTPQEVVDRMLELAQVKAGDVVYDLGSGDGRIVVTAAKKYGVKAIGFEIEFFANVLALGRVTLFKYIEVRWKITAEAWWCKALRDHFGEDMLLTPYLQLALDAEKSTPAISPDEFTTLRKKKIEEETLGYMSAVKPKSTVRIVEVDDEKSSH